MGSAGLILLLSLCTAPQDERLRGPIESLHFRFFHMEGERGAAEDLARESDLLWSRVLGDLGTRRPEMTTVILAATHQDMQELAPGGTRVPTWAAGMAFPKQRLILLKTRSGTGRADRLDEVFLHEWAHVALDHAVSFRPLPRWFKEGFAIFQSGEWSFGRVRALAGGVLSGRLFSLDTLGDRFPKSPLEVELAYAQSIDFVAFLLGEYGRVPFHRLIQLLREGWPFFLAVEEAYDDGIFAIEEAWHRDLKMRFTWIPLLTGTATLWFAATLIFIAAYVKKRRRKVLGLQVLDAGDASPGDDDEPPPPLTAHSP